MTNKLFLVVMDLVTEAKLDVCLYCHKLAWFQEVCFRQSLSMQWEAER